MAWQHQSRLDDTEKLRLYSQSAASHYQTLNATFAKAESAAKHWEREVEDSVTRVIRAEKERDEAKQEAKAAQLVAALAGDAKARAEVNLTTALNSLAAAEEGVRRSEAEATAKRLSLLD